MPTIFENWQPPEREVKVKNFKPCEKCGVGTGTSRQLITTEYVREGVSYFESKWEWIKHREPCRYEWLYTKREMGKRIVRSMLVCSGCYIKLAKETLKDRPDKHIERLENRRVLELNKYSPNGGVSPIEKSTSQIS
jgi:hypothetical protein